MSAALFPVAALLTSLVAADWDDDDYYFAAGEATVPMSMARNILYSDGEILDGLRRVGLSDGCAYVEGALLTKADAQQEEWRDLIVLIAREEFPDAEKNFRRPPHGILTHHGRTRMMESLRDTSLYREYEMDALKEARSLLSRLPDAGGDWKGRYWNWDFERRTQLVFQSACLAEASPDPDRLKAPLDGFFMKKGRD